MRQLSIISLIFFSSHLWAQAESNASMELDYAKNFKISTYATHTLLTVTNESQGSTHSHQYALVPKSAELPALAENVIVVRTPVQRIVVMETVYIGYLEAINQLDTIVGAATIDFISQPLVKERAINGKIETIQSGQSLNIESLLLLQPDLILTSISGDPAFDVPARLLRSGLPVVITAGYMEQHPLARSEWIKFIAPFFNANERADQVFKESAAQYQMLTKITDHLEARPSVFCGAPYSSTWHIAGGNSFTAKAIKDAGGDYLWSNNNQQGGIPLNTERVFLKAADADFWINPSHYRALDDLLGADNRFRKFLPTQTGQVFNNTKQVGDKGGNNIWERGIVHPEEVLADLIHIFHPKLLPDHELIYYEKL